MLYQFKNFTENQPNSLLNNLGFKEKLLWLLINGWSGLGIILGSWMYSFKSRRNTSHILMGFLLITIGFCLSIFIAYFSFVAAYIILLSIFFLFLAIDASQNKLENNITIHLINSGYIGIGSYILFMTYFPDNFPGIWKTIIPSASIAMYMIILCLLFQNIGYYFFWWLFQPITTSIENWSNSNKNLLNLDFHNNSSKQIVFFIFLISLGLFSRLWNLSLGRIYYTEGSGVPFYISSFLAQFDRLYTVGWLYGYAISLNGLTKRKSISRLTWILLSLEFIYQLFSGSKGRFFNFVILPLVSIFILIRQKISWAMMTLVTMLGLASWLIIYPLLTVYRNLIAVATFEGNIDPVRLISQAVAIISKYSWDKYIEIILTPLNSSGIAEQIVAVTSIIHHNVSQEGYLLWQRLFLFWIPRFIWSDKPVAISGNLIGRLSGRVNAEDFTTSVLTTGFGELFLYYGLWGSAMMILAGLVFRWFNEAASPFKIYSPFKVAVFIAFLPLLQTLLGGAFESVITGIILQLGILYTVLSIFKMIAK